MLVTLFAVEQFAIDEVTARLRDNGFDLITHKLTPALKAVGEIEKAVLIYPGQGIVAIGEQTTIVRNLIGDKPRLILCVPQPSPSDRDLLEKCGASTIISPLPWSASNVAERILAELILAEDIQPNSFGPLQGATQPMRDLYKEMATLATLDEPVLILGETGTGKELVAQELHNRSERKGQFLPILCPAISPDLLPSELFGHKEGSFTDAKHNRKGMLIEAGKGTAFLDEIGDLDLKAQAQLLRVLENRMVKPVGANAWEEIQARIILATNRNLEQECAEGKFRYDLYMRLQGFTLRLPPLRERRADLPLLAHYFIKSWDEQHSTNLKIPEGALDCLFNHDWPGNVRELQKVISRASAFADKATQYISAAILQDSVSIHKTGITGHTLTFNPEDDSLRDVVKRAERQYLQAVLSLSRGNKEVAAKRSGLSRSQFYEKLKEIDRT
jgi:DNA-binding NtrC family response regulator